LKDLPGKHGPGLSHPGLNPASSPGSSFRPDAILAQVLQSHGKEDNRF